MTQLFPNPTTCFLTRKRCWAVAPIACGWTQSDEDQWRCDEEPIGNNTWPAAYHFIMGGESEKEMVERHIRRATELVRQQRLRVPEAAAGPDQVRAAYLLAQLERALELHKEHLAMLLRW
jgi:hypothetical protein